MAMGSLGRFVASPLVADGVSVASAAPGAPARESPAGVSTPSRTMIDAGLATVAVTLACLSADDPLS